VSSRAQKCVLSGGNCLNTVGKGDLGCLQYQVSASSNESRDDSTCTERMELEQDGLHTHASI
jgi:hypothetical protein